MIGGAVQGPGGPALASYLADAQPGSSRGLMSEDIKDQVDELTDMAAASGQKQAIRHAYASPPPGAEWGDEEWDAYWTLYERAQGLQGCPYSEAVHDKPGEDGRPPHRHRVYLALTERGTLVRDGWSYARQEAVSRIMEADTGAAFVKGAHNVRAARIAAGLGREDVAAAMAAAGLLDGSRARAALTPGERAQQERTGITKADVARATAAAWTASGAGLSLSDALHAQGLRLAWGDKKDVPVVVDRTGNTHGLAQMLRMAARAAGTKAPKPEAVAVRLDGSAVPPVDEVRAEIHAEEAGPAVPLHDHEGAAPTPDGAAAPAAAGQSIPSLTEQAPAADATHPPQPFHVLAHAESLAASPAPMDGQAAVPSGEPRPTLPVAGGRRFGIAESPWGGGTPDAGGDGGGGGGGAALESIDGPGEPPGPGASIHERQRWRERFIAYEERKGQALKLQQAALAAENDRKSKKGGSSHGHVPAQVGTGTPSVPSALAILAAGRYAWPEARPRAAPIRAERGHGTHGQPVAGRDTRDQGQGAGGGEPVGEPDGTRAGRAAEPDSGNPVCADSGARIAAPPGAADGGTATDARQAIQAAAAQARLAAGLAAHPDATARLRLARQELDPAWREQRDADARIAADRRRIASVLSTHPHPDPASRNGLAREAAEERAARDEHTARVDAQAAMARAAARAAFHGRNPLTWLRNVMLGSNTHKQERLTVMAELAAADLNTRPDDDTLRAARERGRLYAMAARERTSAWEDLPEVAEAMEQDRLNHAVDAAARDGNPAVTRALKLGDPEAARAAILAGEAEERRQAMHASRLACERHGPGGPTTPGTGGPMGPK